MNTKQMFLDLTSKEERAKHKPKYTIQESDVVVDGFEYKSLYRLYMQAVDEYAFACDVFGGLPEWHALLGTKWFTKGFRTHRGIDAWREDMDKRDQSAAKKTIMLASSEGDVPAAKKLWDISKPATQSKRGTFKKAEVLKEVERSKEDSDFLTSAAARLNVVDFK